MNEAGRIYGFPPVFDEKCRILICGSMPSVASLEQSFYYAHPRNSFWPMISEILNEPYPKDISSKKELLLRHHIALWDTISSCEREGSLDSAIRSPQANNFAELFRACPKIHAILFNGTAAMNLYRKYVRPDDPDRKYFKLPSTSPAYALNYEEKKRQWREIILEVLNSESY